ncbi:MAG TPA: hypothetical protein VES39_06635, partial [Rhodospirillales bacterium]|nr:hypothetical protein [Rhodospirillales bacterium]
PLVRTLADYVAEKALAGDDEIAARSAALFADTVATRTVLALLQLRSQIVIQRTDAEAPRHLLAEECVAVQLKRDDPPVLLDDADCRHLLGAAAVKNMAPEHRTRVVERALADADAATPAIVDLARARATQLLADHTRVRDAAIGRREAKGYRIAVEPCLPVDLIGVTVLVPAQA